MTGVSIIMAEVILRVESEELNEDLSIRVVSVTPQRTKAKYNR